MAPVSPVGPTIILMKGTLIYVNYLLWTFRKASDQGHPHASYNLAVGHIQGIRKDILERGYVHIFLDSSGSFLLTFYV